MTETVDVRERNQIKPILLPDFTGIALSNEEPIGKALDIVFKAKGRSILPAEREILIKNVSFFAKGDNVGSLRAAQDSNWKELDISLIFRIYLKQLIMQSQALTAQQILECDFNSGMHYDWISVQHILKEISSLGFSRNEALEAIIVTNQESNDVQSAVQYLLLDEESRKIEYQREKQKRNQYVPPNRHWTIIKRKIGYNNYISQCKKKSENELLCELQKVKEDLNSLRKKRVVLEEKRDEIVKESQLILYKEYIRGTVADHKINTLKLTEMERCKMQRKITEEEHMNIIKNLGIGYDDDSFYGELKEIYGGDIAFGYNVYELMVFGFCRKYYLNTYYNMKIYWFPNDIVSIIINYVMMRIIFDKDFVAYGEENECVVCFEPPKDHMVIPCNHICLCPWCAEENFPAPHDGQICPLCSSDIQDVKQVYYY